MLPVPFITIFAKGIDRRKILKDDTDRVNFLDRLSKVLSETGRNISTWETTDKSQSKKPFLLLGGQYKYSAWRVNSIRKWIFTDG